MTVPFDVGAKSFQSLPFHSPEHEAVYGTLRNCVEGMNSFLKDSAHEGMDQPGRRRVLGMASQSVLVAFQIVAANLRKITGFLREVAEQRRAAASNRRHRTRRRRTETLAERTDAVSPREGPIRAPPG